jgi:hypothetical protein
VASCEVSSDDDDPPLPERTCPPPVDVCVCVWVCVCVCVRVYPCVCVCVCVCVHKYIPVRDPGGEAKPLSVRPSGLSPILLIEPSGDAVAGLGFRV